MRSRRAAAGGGAALPTTAAATARRRPSRRRRCVVGAVVALACCGAALLLVARGGPALDGAALEARLAAVATLPRRVDVRRDGADRFAARGCADDPLRRFRGRARRGAVAAVTAARVASTASREFRLLARQAASLATLAAPGAVDDYVVVWSRDTNGTAACAALRAGLPAAWPLRCVDEAALEPKLATYDDRRFDDYGGDGAYRDRRGPVCKSISGLGRPDQTLKFSSSVKSKSIWLVFGRVVFSRRILEARLKSSRRNCRV